MTQLESVLPHTVVLRTAFSAAECAARLKAATASWFDPLTTKPVRAIVTKRGAMLAPSRIWASRMPVRLRLTAEQGGTRIDASAGWAPVSLITLAVVGAVAVVGFVTLLWERSLWLALGLPLVVVGLLAFALWASAAMTRASHTEILEFIRLTLEAEPRQPL